VQGRLRGEQLSFTIETECGHCHRPLHIEIDSELTYHLVEQEAEPLVYAPLVDLHNLDESSIIDSF
jgi:uncharacterized metal-binding protein YceD (DUF177 family)